MRNLLFRSIFWAGLSLLVDAHASEDKLGVSAGFPAVSPISAGIIFSTDLAGPSRIFAADIDGGNVRQISKTSVDQMNVHEVEPAFSPDGRYIAYAAIRGTTSDIWIMQSDGTNATQITHNGARNRLPVWSPDGTKIAFISDRDGTNDIWMINVDGTHGIKIVGLPGEESQPSFSPRGDWIVFSETEDDTSSLMVVKPNGTNLRRITTGFHDWEPNWGPAGIVFSSNRDGSGRWKLWTVLPDGSGLLKPGDFAGHSPVWTRDNRIIFADEISRSRALSSISLLNPATRVKVPIVDVQGYPAQIDVRPDSAQNIVNPESRGEIEVAILSTKKFDATSNVSKESITFGRSGDEQSLSTCNKKARDVNGDGLPDLSCFFFTEQTGFRSSDARGVLRFFGMDGIPYEASDAVRIVPQEKP